MGLRFSPVAQDLPFFSASVVLLKKEVLIWAYKGLLSVCELSSLLFFFKV